MDNNIYYVYVYLDIFKPGEYFFKHKYGAGFMYAPFYVGKGKNKRMYAHLEECRKYKEGFLSKNFNIIKLKKINKHFEHQISCPVLIVDDNLSEEVALNLEKELIKTFGRIDNNTGILSNMTNGGDGGGFGRIQTNEEKIKRSTSYKKTISDNPNILINRGKKQSTFNRLHPDLVKIKGERVRKTQITNGSALGYKHPLYKELNFKFIIDMYFKIKDKKTIIFEYNKRFENPKLGYTTFDRILKILKFPSNNIRVFSFKEDYISFVNENINRIDWYKDNYKSLEKNYYNNILDFNKRKIYFNEDFNKEV